MTIFDLVFLVFALSSLIGLLAALAMVLLGRGAKARRLVRTLAVVGGVYLGVSVVVAFFAPPRVLSAGTPWCFDDWCLAVDRISEPVASGERLASPHVLYTADLRIFSRARRVSQRAKGAWIYLTDAQGVRYAPTAAAGEMPLDVVLQPGEVRRTTRTFSMPAGVRPVGLITGHGGGYCGMTTLLVIGHGGCLFGKPTMMDVSHD